MRQTLLDAIIARDGDRCFNGLCPTYAGKPVPAAIRTIHHFDGNKRHNAFANLRLLCKPCNTAESNRRRAWAKSRRRKPDPFPQLRSSAVETARPTEGNAREPNAQVTGRERERDNAQGDGPQSTPFMAIPSLGKTGSAFVPNPHPAFGSAEMAANYIMDRLWRARAWRIVLAEGYIEKADAVDGGAEYVRQRVGRGSPETTARYFRMAIAPREGYLIESHKVMPYPVWIARDDDARRRMAEELAEEPDYLKWAAEIKAKLAAKPEA